MEMVVALAIIVSAHWMTYEIRAFAIELPVAIIGFSLVLLIVRLPPLPTQRTQVDQNYKRDVRPQLKMSFDVLGGVTLSLFVSTFVFALSMGGNDLPWSHPAIPILLSISLVSFIGFVIIEKQTSKAPLVPLQVIIQRSIWPLFTITFFKDMAFMTVSDNVHWWKKREREKLIMF